MEKNWYVVHVYSGFEKKIAQQIKEQAERSGLISNFDAILVPSENVVDQRRGRKFSSEQRIFPGYVLIKMNMTDEAWHLVKNTPKVTGFLGGKARPVAISDMEADRILMQSRDGASKQRPSISFDIGEQIRVSEGPFATFNGLIEEVDEERGRVIVTVSIFGRSTPVDLEYSQIEKV